MLRNCCRGGRLGCGDVLQTPFPTRSFDLVSLQYPALPKAAGEPPCGRCSIQCAGRIAPGRVPRPRRRAPGAHEVPEIDPDDYVGADDLVQLLGDDFAIELNVIEPRIDPPPETPHVADTVLRARRR